MLISMNLQFCKDHKQRTIMQDKNVLSALRPSKVQHLAEGFGKDFVENKFGTSLGDG